MAPTQRFITIPRNRGLPLKQEKTVKLDFTERRPSFEARIGTRPSGSLDLAEVERENIGNIFRLEHVNLRVPDPLMAMVFYMMGMGFTRDPHFIVGPDNMWITVGDTQFHMPVGKVQVLRGHIGIVMPNLDALVGRLTEIKSRLNNTQFGWSRDKSGVWVTCPWGNRFHCYVPSNKHAGMRLGLGVVQLNVPMGTAAGIGRFYDRVMDTPIHLGKSKGKARLTVLIGGNQQLIFQETDAPIPPFDGHHIAVYTANMSKAFGWLLERGLLVDGLARHQYRFTAIVDPATDEKLFDLEQEVRSFKHPMFLRPLINRDPLLSIMNYSGGERPTPTLPWGP